MAEASAAESHCSRKWREGGRQAQINKISLPNFFVLMCKVEEVAERDSNGGGISASLIHVGSCTATAALKVLSRPSSDCDQQEQRREMAAPRYTYITFVSEAFLDGCC